MHTPPEQISIGDRLLQEEIEDAFNTRFGYQISGINPRRDDTDNRYLLLFANEDGPYDDTVRAGRFEYMGEGLDGDQSESSPGNSALIDAVSANFPVYFFYAGTDRPEWEYQGQVDVLGYQYEKRDDRSVLVFTIEHHQGGSDALSGEEPSQEAIEEEKSKLTEAIQSEPKLTREDTAHVKTRRKARDSAFRELVREAYNNTCAICGSQRESPDGDPEVEAAHIYPHSKDGSDDIRNGIALCQFHHWAFDSGWLSFTDNHEIIVTQATNRNGYHELNQLAGQLLRLPENEDMHPHPVFLRAHRHLKGF